MLGKPRHYVMGTFAGLAAATVAGILFARARIGFFGFLWSILVGYAVASVVVRASARQRHPGVQATAAATTAAGLAAGTLLAGLPPGALVRAPFLFVLVVSAGAAAFFSGR